MELPEPILRELPEEILGQRIVIRPRRPDDALQIWEAVEESREQARLWLPWVDKTLSINDCVASGRRAIAQWITREDLGVSVFDRATGRFLGGSGLHRIKWDVPSFEIGYWLRTSAQGRGYMTECVQVLCTFCFESLEAARVFICCDSRNERSSAIPRRLGFLHEATLHNDARDRDRSLRDTEVHALTPERYWEVKTNWAENSGQ